MMQKVNRIKEQPYTYRKIIEQLSVAVGQISSFTNFFSNFERTAEFVLKMSNMLFVY